ncbi:hypothetical protein CHGG_00495 [Chaetomium globosum CBS 148.51]|uniref:C2H2-type domain-containing protein n=1 Tax=Chaetomium globosum (strain ATCC 6205 / CBS 148.51 / DSM 1962 / NBRC 6347 / NRRL 1970) TaxID=306901 RepID=Q2HH09_CHAGB|nr:uncharacterized protein CHGG_00495 [Chaetomium globosum CBS 148.51]EAQ92260.1 hypothetical protein CHGG_00495 [Chaetomium globosum CBS 148.51]
MEPSSKRRRLAPKVPEPPAVPALPPTPQIQPQPPPHAFPQDQVPPQHYPHAEPVSRLPECDEFEAFARHLQDAAIHIQQQTLRPKHTSVSVLMLRWEEDTSVEPDLLALEQVFHERYHYHIDKWTIPTVPNPSVKLGVRMASFLDNARPDHLLIIYYAGHGYVGPDNQLYWACNSRDDAAKLKWDGSSLESGPNSFTATLSETLSKLSTSGRPFSAQKLYDDLRQQGQQESTQALARQPNGPSKPGAAPEKLPAFFTLTPAKGQGIILVPLDPKAAQLQSPPHSADADVQSTWTSKPEDRPVTPEEVLDLTLDERRVLVCTTFVGDASPDMAFFNQWLHNIPGAASKFTVEGMFLGPPTMLLISMPLNVWNIVQHDKVCCFLGYINSHNMIHLYQRLVNAHPSGLPSLKDDEDGCALQRSPSVHRSEILGHYPALQKEAPRRQGSNLAQAVVASMTAIPPQTSPGQTPPIVPKDEVEDSAEMQEAAEQLKALSHVRHMGDDTPSTLDRQATRVGDSIAVRHVGDPGSPANGVAPGAERAPFDAQYSTPTAKPKVRKPLQKQAPKQEVRCDYCSHAPFKDSSSLRSADGKGNEFNRKDLFTQHLRRMHAPFAIKKALSKGDNKLQAEWDTHVKEMQTTCLVTRRQPPQRSACPKPDCQSVFEGPGSWDEWTEHVGRHMEKGEAHRMGVDQLLAQWALDECIIENHGDGEYRLCGGNGSGVGENHLNNNGKITLDGVGKTDEDDNPSITVAIPGSITNRMDVD